MNEQHLVTLSGEGDWCAIMWQWGDQFKMLAKVDLHVMDPVEPLTFQISLANIMSDMVCVVTGTSTYKYMKLEDKGRSFREMHSQLVARNRGDAVSTNYTCHAWAKDKVQLVVCTAEGDILVCAMSGEFLIYIP